MDLDLTSYFSQAMRFYKSPSQIAKNVTETWANDNLYCPRCGLPLHQYKNNTKVYDFYCDHSDQKFMVLPSVSMDNFQLKSTKSFPNNHFPVSITGAGYDVTLTSLEQGVFPSLILLHYQPELKEVQDGLLIHRLTITKNSISRRVPLNESARRARWVGTNILLRNIPEIGKIPMIQESKIVPKRTVMQEWLSVEGILKGDLDKRGWISEIMLVLDRLPETFSLDDVYSYEQRLGSKYPNNKHVKDKIRQQIQILRDQGYLKFISRGRYLKLGH